jgi:hypothetical protein
MSILNSKSNLFDISKYDVVFLSYDEPNADENWNDLITKIPSAKRVHGIKGSDAAHKAVANLATTDRVVIIDADNRVFGDFTNQRIQVDQSIDPAKVVFTWPAKNTINGLTYGNGGIKCWPKQLILDIKTHENAPVGEIESQIEFCWNVEYLGSSDVYSEIFNNASPMQAWRAGFREGVKLSLDRGRRVESVEDIWKDNLNRLLIWMTVGNDAVHGIWSILGARQGCAMTLTSDWNFTDVRDFDKLTEIWNINCSQLSESQVITLIDQLGEKLKIIFDVPKMFTESQARFFKEFDFNPAKRAKSIKTFYNRYDIIMITYNEPNAEENWLALKTRFPNAKRVDGIKGIHNAHKVAASIATTDMFWVVDGDARIVDTFKFDHILAEWEGACVKVWRSQNPVNGLVYGNGGVKLLPKIQTIAMQDTTTDMTTSISKMFTPNVRS